VSIFQKYLFGIQTSGSKNTCQEDRNLFNLVQFLMYDKEFCGTISVEQTLQILFVRYGREKLDSEIAEIFGDDHCQRGADGQEKRISFGQYVERVNSRLAKIRCAKKEVTKVVGRKN